nr:MAG TPA: hypothetical protein [Caudoviricetes sp.]
MFAKLQIFLHSQSTDKALFNKTKYKQSKTKIAAFC